MNLSEAFSQINSMGLSSPKLIPSEMTDEELSHVRFTTFSKEDEEAIIAELKKRNLALRTCERPRMSKQLWNYLRSRVQVVTSDCKTIKGLVTDFTDEMDNDEQDEITILIDNPSPDEQTEISLFESEIVSIKVIS